MKTENQRRVLITGANRGIGLAFAQECLNRGDQVFAGCRDASGATALQDLKAAHPENCVIVELDITDKCSIGASFETIQKQAEGLDLLVNNAAYTTNLFESIDDFQSEIMLRHFQVNAFASMEIIQRYLRLLRKGRNAKIATVSSEAGSFHSNAKATSFRGYSYPASKTALNMLLMILTAELRPQNISVVSLHPGFVRTRADNSHAPLSPKESVEGMLKIIENLTTENSGGFYRYDGSTVEW
ncbi:MAG: SDR family oxidoreductase [Chthoniobacterales bacterium]